MLVRTGGDRPVGWYDGTSVHLDDRSYGVYGLQDVVTIAGGLAGVLEDGTVVVVTTSAVTTVGRTRPGQRVVGSTTSSVVAWVDPGGRLVLGSPDTRPVRRALPPTARVALRDGEDTYLSVRGGGHLLARGGGPVLRRPGPVPLDVAGEVRVESTPAGLRVVGAGPPVDLTGLREEDLRLSADGRHLVAGAVTSSQSGVGLVLDRRTGEPVDLPVPDDGRILDIAFGPAATVTMVLSRPDGAQFPKTVPRGDGSQPGYDIITCRLRDGTCESTVQLDGATAAPLIAH